MSKHEVKYLNKTAHQKLSTTASAAIHLQCTLNNVAIFGISKRQKMVALRSYKNEYTTISTFT